MDDGPLGAEASLVDVGAREIVRATGGDRVAFLQRLVTGDVAGTPVGGGSHSLLLNVKGHIVSDMRVFPRADEVWLVVAPGQGAATAGALNGYAIMDDFAAAPVAGWAPLGLFGSRSVARLAEAGVPLPPDFAGTQAWSQGDATVGEGAAWAVRARGFGGDGVWLFADEPTRQELRERLERAGVPWLDHTRAEVLRIESGEPAWGAEITADYFPMEVGLGGAIDYGKGCFLGQEPIVRIRDRGHINWRLVRLHARSADAPLPAAGDVLASDAKPRAGRVTSAARLPEEPPVALALLHVSVPVGSEVRITHGTDVVTAVVLDVPPIL